MGVGASVHDEPLQDTPRVDRGETSEASDEGGGVDALVEAARKGVREAADARPPQLRLDGRARKAAGARRVGVHAQRALEKRILGERRDLAEPRCGEPRGAHIGA